MKRLSFIFLACLFATSAMQAQSVADWLQTARTAFENSEYRTVLTNVAKIEEAVGSATKPATAYLRIMSHYRLQEYEQCISSANAYLADKPAQDETLQEINNAVSESEKILASREAERQRQLAEQETERQRQAELARQKSALEKEAVEQWETLKNSSDLSALSSFLTKYKGTQSETSAQQRYDDETAWQTAKKENYVESYEKYLTGSTLKNHRQEALALLEESYPRLAKKYAEEGNVEKMDNVVERYFKTFPNGAETDNLEKTMCEVYVKKGVDLSKTFARRRNHCPKIRRLFWKIN
ncbi:MAG: hypothetical protein LBN95_13110 [Prevotellaceae bacterium]|jgi:hypothetical protein|nr:hypothetical protein [Prevotellaceae bacterium]